MIGQDTIQPQTIESAPPRGAEQLRLALAMRGGVSLAVWIGGAVAEIERLRLSALPTPDPDSTDARPINGDRYSKIYDTLLQYSRYDDVVVDVLAGTSAGGLNGAIYAASRVYDFDFSQMADLWLTLADIEHLIEDTTTAHPKSLLQGDTYFLAQLRSKLAELAGAGKNTGADGAPQSTEQERIDLVLTTTLVEPSRSSFFDAAFNPINEPRSTAFFRFRHEGEPGSAVSDFDRSPVPTTDRLALAGRSTSSFPVAFAPAEVPAEEYADVFSHPSIDGESTQVIDGGVLDNIPVAQAIRSTAAAPATGDARRWLIYLHPSPATESAAAVGENTPGSATGRKERIFAVLKKTLALKLDHESLIEDMDALSRHNARVGSRQAHRRSAVAAAKANVTEAQEAWARADAAHVLHLVNEPGAARANHHFPGPLDTLNYSGWPKAARREFQQQLVREFEQYHRSRQALPLPALMDTVESLIMWAQSLDPQVNDDAAGAVPTTLGTDRQTLYRLRLVCEVLNATWEQEWIAAAQAVQAEQAVNEHAAGSAPDDPPELTASVIQSFERSETFPAGIVIELRKAEESATGLHNSLAQYAAGGASTDSVNKAGLDDLWELAAEVATRLPASPHPYSEFGLSNATIGASAAALRDAAIKTAKLHSRRLDGESSIQFLRVSGASPSPLWAADDDRLADPTSKLAGNQFINFGAFFKDTWRANDWVWGRADAALGMVDLLTDPVRWMSDVTAPDGVAARKARIERELAALCGAHWSAAAAEEIANLPARISSDDADPDREDHRGDNQSGRDQPTAIRELVAVKAALVSALHEELFAAHLHWVNDPKHHAIAPAPWAPPVGALDLVENKGTADSQQLADPTLRLRAGNARLPQDLHATFRARVGMRLALVAWRAGKPRGVPGKLLAVFKPVYLFLIAIVLQPRRSIGVGMLGSAVLVLGPWSDTSASAWDWETPAACTGGCQYFSWQRAIALASMVVLFAVALLLEWLSYRRRRKKQQKDPSQKIWTWDVVVSLVVPVNLLLTTTLAFWKRWELPMASLPIAAVVVVLVGMHWMSIPGQIRAVGLAVLPYVALDLLFREQLSSGWRALLAFALALALNTIHATYTNVFPQLEDRRATPPRPNQESHVAAS